MNLYAIVPVYAPNCEVDFILAETDAEALDHGVYVAADDAVNGYRSPEAEVYCIARGVEQIGTAQAIDAPREWEWAHPGVEEAATEWECIEVELTEPAP